MVLSVVLKKEKWRKRCFYLAFAMLVFFSNSFISNEVMRAWEVSPIPLSSVEKSYEVGIVLGGVILGDTEIKDRAFFSKGADRIYHTAMLYKRGKIKRVLVSGGTSRLIDIGQREGLEMVAALEEMGVKKEHIEYEITSRNTHENALESKKKLEKSYDSSDCLLITSAFHMRRAEACFAKVNYPVDVFSVDIYSSKTRFTPDVLFVPSVGAFANWHILIKEWVGFTAYWVMGYV